MKIPPNFLFLSIKMFFFPYRVGTWMELAMVADFKLQFFAVPKETHFAAKIPGYFIKSILAS